MVWLVVFEYLLNLKCRDLGSLTKAGSGDSEPQFLRFLNKLVLALQFQLNTALIVTTKLQFDLKCCTSGLVSYWSRLTNQE